MAKRSPERRWCAQDVHHFVRWALALEPKSPDPSPAILLRSVTGKTGQWLRHARPEAAGAESHGGGRKALPKAGSPIKHQRPRWPSLINPGNQLPCSDFPAVTAFNGFGLKAASDLKAASEMRNQYSGTFGTSREMVRSCWKRQGRSQTSNDISEGPQFP